MNLYKRVKEWVLDRPYPTGKMVMDRYEIMQTIGMGSYGITYIVLDHLSGEKRVLKQVKPSRQGTPYGKPSYEYEVQVMGKINHPQMPVFYDAFTEKNKLYLTMNYIPGKTLEELIFDEGKTFTEKESFSFLLDLLPLIEYIHDHKIIHRDIRLPNILDHQGTYYLIDFGLARFIGTPLPREDDDLSEGKQMRRIIHVHSDFYALGHLLLFLLYTTYNDTGEKEEKSWEEELAIGITGKNIIRRLLQLDPPFDSVPEIRKALQSYLNQMN